MKTWVQQAIPRTYYFYHNAQLFHAMIWSKNILLYAVSFLHFVKELAVNLNIT